MVLLPGVVCLTAACTESPYLTGIQCTRSRTLDILQCNLGLSIKAMHRLRDKFQNRCEKSLKLVKSGQIWGFMLLAAHGWTTVSIFSFSSDY